VILLQAEKKLMGLVLLFGDNVRTCNLWLIVVEVL
jgi:hypothetical protein